jgi:hypothetical protein
MSNIVPISPVLSIGKLQDPPPVARRAGANTPVTWGELYLLFTEAGQVPLVQATLAKIAEIDGRVA